MGTSSRTRSTGARADLDALAYRRRHGKSTALSTPHDNDDVSPRLGSARPPGPRRCSPPMESCGFLRLRHKSPEQALFGLGGEGN
nr:unnamed protein product [Digitaria exilis]